MRTLLSQFCEEFEQGIRPLLPPLEGAAEALSAAAPGVPGRENLAELKELSQQLEMLASKVAEQQAYVLIFGPLKSGKSTLMNAFASSYVSEVTSLPAYPCMVYVSHGEKRMYRVTRYDGDTAAFTDSADVKGHISRAHAELAERIRVGEESEEAFDPMVHFPEAIKRVDVRLPAGNLARSGAVMVDTPGLYARMKFGYDRMTREFRNAAACAIFVVKSDNLFLEQVFAEFTDLLQLFSRIFLVVNLDRGKRDLAPDGRLVPSLESQDPRRIIEAFESLVMSRPLKAAMEEGRLQIHPVDLLHAASRRLMSARSDFDPADPDLPAEEERGASFDDFLQDLTDYLNSTDYLVAFLGDSLRRAGTLLGETSELCHHGAFDALARGVEHMEAEKRLAAGRREAAARLAAADWRPAYEELRGKLRDAAGEPARRLADATRGKLRAAVDDWFSGAASFQDLTDAGLRPVLEEHQRALVALLHGELADRVRAGKGGLRPSAETERDLAALELDLDRLGAQALRPADEALLVEPVPQPVDAGNLPVRVGFLDRLLLRNAASVRRRLLGPVGEPTLRIPADVKAARLGAPARASIEAELEAFADAWFATTLARIANALLRDHADRAIASLAETFAEKRERYAARSEELEATLALRRGILARLAELRAATERASAEIEALTARYGKTDPDLLVQPVGERALPPPLSKEFTGEAQPSESGSAAELARE